MIGFKSLARKTTNLLLALALVSAQLFAPISAIIPKATAVVNDCVIDTAGANDEPNQKDLTKLCVDDTAISSIDVTWNWDDRGTSGGGQTMDGCALFDTDDDGYANYSVCVATTGKEPAQFGTLTIYSCGDTRPDRCTSTATPLATPYATQCSVSEKNTDPFGTGNSSPIDTEADCTIVLSDVGGVGTTELLDVCSYPSGQPNSDPSDCVILRDNSAKIEIIKQILPDTDSGKFNLQLDGLTKLADAGDGDSTGEIIVDSDNNGEVFAVSETAGTSTTLANYTASIECKDMNGNGSIVASSATTSVDVTIDPLDDIVCVITNTLQTASIQVVKNVINDNGGDKTYQDFTFQVEVNSPQSFDADVNDVQGFDGTKTISVPIGATYDITEPEANQDGYSTSYSGCTDITPVVGQTQVCTITNNDNPPSLTLNKILSNAHGGNATESDWTLTASGPTTISGPGASGNTDVVSGATFSAGTYTLSESAGPAGYTANSWTCTNGVTVNANSQITIANGQTTVCTITNSETAPALTLVKNVINNNGGTLEADDFVLRLNGTAQNSPVMSNSNLTATYNATNVASNTVYTLTEDANSTYAASAVSCVDDITQLAVFHPVTLSEGQSVTCTITNNDISPTLQLIKSVINLDGGIESAESWTLTAQETGESPLINEQGVSTDGGVTAETGVYDAFAGTIYNLSEAGPNGYTSSVWSCNGGTLVNGTITLGLAQNVICTITNNDDAPSLTIVKNVVNDDGGTNTVSDFGITMNSSPLSFGSGVVNGSTTTYTATPTVLANTAYTLTENDVDGYSEGTWTCTDGSNGTGRDVNVNLALDEDVICTITNNDIAPLLTLKKEVVSADETKTPSDWTLTATPTTGTVISGNGENGVKDEAAMASVNYTLTESTEIDGDFDASDWSCTSSAGVFSNPNGINNEIRMSVGANVTCTITNTERATVTVTKYNDYNRDGDNNDEPLLPNWGFNLRECESVEVRNLAENGCNGDLFEESTGSSGEAAKFSSIKSGVYDLTEDFEEGWHFSNAHCVYQLSQTNGFGGYIQENVETYRLNIVPGAVIECFVGNYRDAYMLIEKTNNRPEPTVVGDIVTYTLTVTVPEDSNPVYDVTVTDLPPEGFNYIPGSETASKPGAFLEHPYASPGIWSLGDLYPGDVVTLAYQTRIADSASPGTYPDLAFAEGCDTPANEDDCEINVYANVTNIDEEGSPFVGTEVTIKEPQVLAANITRLVDTGAADIWRNLAVGTLLMGVAFVTLFGRQKKGGRA